MKIKHPAFISMVLLSLLSLIGTFIIYPNLPSEIAVHFDVNGVADGFSSKSTIFVTALIPFGLTLLFMIIPKIDPRKTSYEKHKQVYSIITILTMFFLIVVHWIIVGINLNLDIPINLVIGIGVGILFTAIGNYMPRIQSNYTFGIRTPWALEDADNWKKTHRIGGYLFTLSGLIILITSIVNVAYLYVAIIAIIPFTVLIPYIASYLYYKKTQ